MSLSRRWIWSLFATLLGCAVFAAIARAQDRTLSPYFAVRDADSLSGRLPLLGTRVDVAIAGVIADVTVRQRYRNDGTHPIHATYVFPASTRAAVNGLTMQVGDERIRATLREREQARRVFAAAKRQGKNAALLEQNRPNVFTMSLVNIVPGQQIEVELHYTELLVPTDGVYEFVYPTVVGPRYSTVTEAHAAPTDHWLRSPYTHAGTPPSYTLDLDATVSAGLPLDALQCPSHIVHVERGDASRAHVVLDPSERWGGNRDFVLRYRLDGGRLQTGLMLYRGADENFFLAMVQPPRQVAPADIPPRDYVFVVDVSGSMMGFPLDTSKELLRDLIGQLRPTDTFNVLLFSGGSTVWSPQPMPAARANIDAAVAMIEQQNGGGGTELLAAMQRALALPRPEGVSRSILVITDGYIGAEQEVFETIHGHLDRANVFAFGIGSSVNRYLIEGIARAGMGEPFVLEEPRFAHAVAGRFRAYVQSPVLTGAHLQFDGFDAYDLEPAVVPDVMAQRPILVQGKWRGTPAGHGPFRQRLDVAAVRPVEANRALRQLWARSRIATVSDFGFAPETDDRRQAIVRLGLTYGLLTKYTSFVAVRERIVNAGGQGREVQQPLPLPKGVRDSAVGMGQGREPGLLALLAATLVAIGVIGAHRRAMRRRV